MLRDLAVREFALVDDLRLEFGEGLTVLTGETGAGKSILVDAIALAVGDRASSDVVRTGCERASVVATFDLGGLASVRAVAKEMGLEEGDELVIRRDVALGGRNRCYMNGTPVTLGMLKRLGDRLVDIHGQHEHQSLLHPECHVDFLDAYLGLARERAAYADAFRTWHRAKDDLQELSERLAAVNEKADYLRFACQELEGARLRPKEDEALEQERRILANVERVVVDVHLACDLLAEGDPSALDALGRAHRSLEEAGRYDPGLTDLAARIETALIEVEDVVRTLGGYGEKLEHRPERLEEINDRLARIERLKRRYHATLDEVLERQREMKQELSVLDDSEVALEEAKKAVRTSGAAVLEVGKNLWKKRAQGAPRLGSEIARVLGDLEMKRTRFDVSIDPARATSDEELLAGAGEAGLENIEFLISPNPGEPAKALGRIASGGEISRIMLALKSVLVEGDEVGTLVFDEIDIGIGGEAAKTLARKLKELSRVRQVLCVTHLPQIAGLADRHYRVEKTAEKGRTTTRVRGLTGEDRIREVSRMIAGANPTQTAIRHAEELIQEGRDISACTGGRLRHSKSR